MKRYKVIQYATGGVGSRSLAAIIDHPQLELVGLLVQLILQAMVNFTTGAL